MLHPEKYPEIVKKRDGWTMHKILPLNMIKNEDLIEFISPDIVCSRPANGTQEEREWILVNPENGTERTWVCDGHDCLIYTKEKLAKGTLIRLEDPEYKAGEIRDSGR